MKCTLLFALSLLANAACILAQQPTNDANPLYRPVTIQTYTIVVPPITAVPFSATAVIENRQILSDGTVAEKRAINLIGRDSRGRTRVEGRYWVPLASKAEPPLKDVSVYDPQTEIRTVYTLATRIATKEHQPAARLPPASSASVNPLVKVEDLGTSTIENIDVRGTRRSVAIPAAAGGNLAPITIVDEYWYSEDLHVNIVLLHNDPRTGNQKVTLTGIKREDPDPSFFEVPEGYKIVDMTPPDDAPVLQHSVH